MEKQTDELSKEFWNDFLKLSDNFKKPLSINNAFCEQTSDSILKNMYDIFQNFDSSARFRVFVNGERRDDLNDMVMNNPPRDNDTLESWTARLFGQQKFGIIFNEGERWSKKFNVDIYHKLKPLLEELGFPMMGMDVTIFIGNYGWTPLGIHMDYLGESVMHLHLGPDKKEMFLWDKDEYLQEAKGKFGEKRPEFFIDKATKYEIEKGGVFYMPWGKPHIGRTQELSAGVSIWYNKPTKQKLLNRIISNIHTEFIGSDQSFIKEHLAYKEHSKEIFTFDYQKDVLLDLYPQLLDVVENKDALANYSFSELLEMSTKDFQYALKSNLHFTFPLKEASDKAPVKINLDDIVHVDHPYLIEMYYSEISKKIHLFVKGQKIMLVNHGDLYTLIERLNGGQKIQIKELLKGLFTDWPIDAGIRLIEILYEKNGFILETNIQNDEDHESTSKTALVATK